MRAEGQRLETGEIEQGMTEEPLELIEDILTHTGEERESFEAEHSERDRDLVQKIRR